MAQRQINRYAENVLTCSEEGHYRGEILLEDHSLVRIVSGELRIVQADRSFVFGAGDSFLFPRNQLSAMVKFSKDDQPYKAIILRLTSSYLQQYYRLHGVVAMRPASHGILTLPPSPLLDSCFDSLLPYFSLENKLPDTIVRVKMEEAIEILRSLDPQVDGMLSDFSTAGKIDLTEFMEKNYMFNLPLERFSSLTGRSLTTFKRDFKKSFHTSPQRWLTQKRLDLAHYQLSQQRRKPVDVYFETGFENLSHFSRAFKKRFGYAPTAAGGNAGMGISSTEIQ